MAKQQKAKQHKGTRNDSRKNGKANKQFNMKHRNGKIDPIMAVIMGKGAFVNINKPKKKQLV